MAKFLKRPVVVEATQWFPGDSVEGVQVHDGADTPTRDGGKMNWGKSYYVTTIHGQRAYLSRGDWVITEPDGVHHYPCKPDIFAATYEPVNEDDGRLLTSRSWSPGDRL